MTWISWALCLRQEANHGIYKIWFGGGQTARITQAWNPVLVDSVHHSILTWRCLSLMNLLYTPSLFRNKPLIKSLFLLERDTKKITNSGWSANWCVIQFTVAFQILFDEVEKIWRIYQKSTGGKQGSARKQRECCQWHMKSYEDIGKMCQYTIDAYHNPTTLVQRTYIREEWPHGSKKTY